MGSGQGADSDALDAQPARRSALPAATLHARRGRGPATGLSATVQPGGPSPRSAPPCKGRGQQQHSPGGRRHACPAPASREVRRQLSPTRSHFAGRGLGGAWSHCPSSSSGKAPQDPEGRSPEGGEDSIYSPAPGCRLGAGLRWRQRPFQKRRELPHAVDTLILPLTWRPSLPRGRTPWRGSR